MSAMFDYIAGKKRGKVAQLEASLEHISGYLGLEIEENEKLRAEIERLRMALQAIATDDYMFPHIVAQNALDGKTLNEQLTNLEDDPNSASGKRIKR